MYVYFPFFYEHTRSIAYNKYIVGQIDSFPCICEIPLGNGRLFYKMYWNTKLDNKK